VFDIAINFLAKINKYLEDKTYFLMGSNEKALAHAYIGPVADYAMALNSYETIWEIIGEYTNKYREKPVRSVPVICYHKQRHKEWLDQLLKPATPETCTFTSNSILAGAMAFLHDVVLNCGPETVQIHELFTNDYRIQNGIVDLSILAKARLAAFHTRHANRTIIPCDHAPFVKEYSHRSYPTSTYVPPPPTPKFVKVRVVECYGELDQDVFVSPFVPTLNELKQMEEDRKKADRKMHMMYQQMYGPDYEKRWTEDWD
jgi:hypothetical protein